MGLTRRFVLGGLLAGAAMPALAGAPATSIRPVPRDPELRLRVVAPAEEIVAKAGLGGEVCYAVADARTGQILESRGGTAGQPPASTAKAITALYALDTLGPDHRFRTRLVAGGPIANGRIAGDLILVGGGDPVLDTDHLAAMAAELKAAGVREVGGALKVWDGSLPRLRQIDAEQPPHVGYNPAVSGLSLNFNRVHFGWKRVGSAYEVTMDARSGSVIPGVSMARMRVVDRTAPIYTYADTEGRDDWTVARGALGEGGSRWLPVRYPALYAGEVFRVLARSHGIMIGEDIGRATATEGTVLAEHESAPLGDILDDMLDYSTNITAEMVGLAASATRGPMPASLADSAGRMNAWLAETLGGQGPSFVDHSGLGDDSRISADTMVRAMVHAGPDSALRRLMKPFPVDELAHGAVDAKTGTLNFVNALAGFCRAGDGTDLAFAILCADVPRRDALPMEQREQPEGGRSYAARARTMQRALLERWSILYGA